MKAEQDARTDEPADERAAEAEAPRGVPPILYPVGALLFGGLLVWGFSQILLAVSEYSKAIASAIALFTALNVLIGSTLVAYGRRVRRRPASFPLLVVAGVLVVAGGLVASLLIGGDEQRGERGSAVTLTASGIAFDKNALTLPADTSVTIRFENKDAGTQHNVSIFEGEDASGNPIFKGEIVTGPASVSYAVPPLAEGSYFFRCDVHPTQMTGTIEATPGGALAGATPQPGGGESPGATGALEVTAVNIAFQPTELTASAGGQITIHFQNDDQGVRHNIHVTKDEAGTETIFQGPIITGPQSVEYTFEAPDPGTYPFRCDVHPTMKGTLKIE